MPFVGGVGTGGTISGVSHALKLQIQTFKFMQLRQTSQLSCLVKTRASKNSRHLGWLFTKRDTMAYDGIVRVTSDDALALGREIGGKKASLLGFLHAAIYGGTRSVAMKLGAE